MTCYNIIWFTPYNEVSNLSIDDRLKKMCMLVVNNNEAR